MCVAESLGMALLQDAFHEELVRHRRQLYARVRHRSDAEDLVQETYLRALMARRTFRVGSNGGAWLKRILQNVTFTEYRREMRRQRLCERLRCDGLLWEPEWFPIDWLRRAWGELSLSDREILSLAADGRSYVEIGHELGIKLGTVMSRLHRARTKLAKGSARR
jgi:RNA polymerase sigma-70 factor (ECF subfamily)